MLVTFAANMLINLSIFVSLKRICYLRRVVNHFNNLFHSLIRYVIVENLRYLLKNKDPMQPVYYGCKFKPFVKQGYMSGGAGMNTNLVLCDLFGQFLFRLLRVPFDSILGYVLSADAVRRFVTEALPNENCRNNHGPEDVEIGAIIY